MRFSTIAKLGVLIVAGALTAGCQSVQSGGIDVMRSYDVRYLRPTEDWAPHDTDSEVSELVVYPTDWPSGNPALPSI